MSREEQGPFDVTEINAQDRDGRIDLGALLIAPTEGVEVQVQADENTGAIVAVTLSGGDGAVQVQPFAAPRSEGMWPDVRAQILAGLASGGGLGEEAEGPFGPELRAQVNPGDGSTGLQPVRFVGVDGPRWFLRGIFLGGAARPGAVADRMDAVFRSLVVVRGREAMPVGSPLPLQLPGVADTAGQAPGRTLPSPFERGPEITEIR